MPPPDRFRWAEAGADKAAAVAGMAARAFEPHYRETWSEAQIAGLLQSGNGWLLIAEDEAGVAAFALCRHAGDEAELLLCATRPNLRRQGLATRMLAAVREGAVQRGGRRLFLEVRASNGPALSLYEANGFRRVGLRPGYYRTLTGHGIDAVTLALDLTCSSSAGTSATISGSLASFPHR